MFLFFPGAVCVCFDEVRYTRIHASYRLLVLVCGFIHPWMMSRCAIDGMPFSSRGNVLERLGRFLWDVSFGTFLALGELFQDPTCAQTSFPFASHQLDLTDAADDMMQMPDMAMQVCVHIYIYIHSEVYVLALLHY